MQASHTAEVGGELGLASKFISGAAKELSGVLAKAEGLTGGAAVSGNNPEGCWITPTQVKKATCEDIVKLCDDTLHAGDPVKNIAKLDELVLNVQASRTKYDKIITAFDVTGEGELSDAAANVVSRLVETRLCSKIIRSLRTDSSSADLRAYVNEFRALMADGGSNEKDVLPKHVISKLNKALQKQ